jgi:hypothetical protein
VRDSERGRKLYVENERKGEREREREEDKVKKRVEVG